MYKNFLLFVVTKSNSEGNIFSVRWTNLQNISMKREGSKMSKEKDLIIAFSSNNSY